MENSKTKPLELRDYANRIITYEDRLLFDEAVVAARAGALRASFIMIWLACVESLKRKFREAQVRDKSAGKALGKIIDAENKHRAADMIVLNEAQKYGFLLDDEFLTLQGIYKSRCLYAHPYEKAPMPEQVVHAAAVAVEYVLSKPLKLKQGYFDQLFQKMISKPTYLDNQQLAVETFAKTTILKIDNSVYSWLLKKYWHEIESIVDDPMVEIFVNRGIWFTNIILKEQQPVFSEEEWHDIVQEYPKTIVKLSEVSPELFSKIGSQAQDTLVGEILKLAAEKTRVLCLLDSLSKNGMLTERQWDRFLQTLESLSNHDIYISGLSICIIYNHLISDLKSHDWYKQNPAVSTVISRGPKQIEELEVDQQIDLGRNILQAAEGESKMAISFIQSNLADEQVWPRHLIAGIFAEMFINENYEVRIKARVMSPVLRVVDSLDKTSQDYVLDYVSERLKNGKLKYEWSLTNIEGLINNLELYDWAECIKSTLIEIKSES